MKVYTARPGSPAAVKFMREHGIGYVVTPDDFRNPPKDIAWIFDNGAFSAWRNARPFDAVAFTKALFKVKSDHPPDFGVLPDIVAGARASLEYSLGWLQSVTRRFSWYLAVQDGISPPDLGPMLRGEPPKEGWQTDIGGLFVGGSKTWKWETATGWVKLAHEHDLKCHIGGVGRIPELKLAEKMGADSVDSSNWSRNGTYWKLATEMQQRTLQEA